jgi:two-component system cell cycle sensor histidine kinase/response regulator CckA
MDDLTTILVVDDEEVVRTAIARVLAYSGYRVLTAADGEQGIELYREAREEIDVLLVDHSLTAMSGAELIERLRGEGAQQPMLLMSGGAVSPRPESISLIKKPFDSETLLQALRDVIDDVR